MGIIEIGEPSLNLLYPFLMPIFWTMRAFFNGFLKADDERVKDPFFLAFIAILGDVLAGALELVEKCRNLPFQTRKRINSGAVQPPNNYINGVQFYAPYKQKKIDIVIPYILIFINSSIECSFLTAFTILGEEAESALICFQMNIVLILIQSMTTYFILKYPIYRHQILSLIIITLGIIAKFFQNLFNDISLFFSYLLIYCFISVLDVSQKWLMEKKHYTPVRLVFLQGVFSTCIFFFAFIIMPFIPCNLSFCRDGYTENFITTVKIYWSDDQLARTFYLIIYLLACSAYVLFVFITIHLFTPTHRCMSDTLGTIVFWIGSLIFQMTEFDYYTPIWYLLIMFSCLVYNDVLILNFCGLDQNTKKKITMRSTIDYISAELQVHDNEETLPNKDTNSTDESIKDNDSNYFIE